MAAIPRKSDGRRIFTAEFKREQIERVTRGDLTLAELGRKLGIAQSLLHRWKRNALEGTAGSEESRAYVRSVAGLRTDQYIRELQLLVGKQTVELELLRAQLGALRKLRRLRGVSKR